MNTTKLLNFLNAANPFVVAVGIVFSLLAAVSEHAAGREYFWPLLCALWQFLWLIKRP